MADRFYTDAPLAPGEFVLAGPDAHHLSTVRRFEMGDRVTLFNGDRSEYPAEILSVGKKQVVVTVLSRQMVNREPPFPVVVGSALPKADRTDYLIEKLTEVGGTLFVPLITSRAVVQPKEAKTDKLSRAVIEASKQCGRNVLMKVDRPQTLTEFVLRPDLPPAKFILHTSGEERTVAVSVDRSTLGQGVAFAVGPEGGFTPEEVSAATAAGWEPISFGPRILRVETAVVVATAWATA